MTEWLEKHFLPVAAKIGAEKHLVAIRDAFISIMPITMAGAVATLLNVFFRDLPTQFGWTGFVDTMSPIIGINSNVWWGTLAILSLVFVFSLGYNLSKAYDVSPLPGGLIAFAALITQMPQTTADGSMWGYINWSYTQASGLFTALFIGFIATFIYIKLVKSKVTIKLPDSVPPAVSRAFTAIIPGLIAIYVIGTLAYVVNAFTGMPINDVISKYVQMPFLGLSQGLISVVITVFAVQLLWMFGLHGSNVLAPVLDGIYLTALNENNVAFMQGAELPYMWTRGSFDAFVWLGGAGCSLALIIAILIFSKKEESRTVAKLSAPMGVFNINEPVTFGLPVVLNPIYFIPSIGIPIILTIIAYVCTSIGLIPPTFVAVPWIMPPVIYAFFATGGSLMAALVALVNLIIAVALYAPFVLLANKADSQV
ncbi:PTS sugar transporter subunit IIC [Niameybacter massiliensis]|uniref:Permease IIC component n=1 Tax=Holtiella tumoricola TaxID=3018743 RepID=A0AA42J0M1_9FIRM|nr:MULTISPECIES: PTS sugar transporter subunit IIC [Lachnospirales]MDA3731313.1 PTS sugar transporter subunit IIC [Holtiella tumoricola]